MPFLFRHMVVIVWSTLLHFSAIKPWFTILPCNLVGLVECSPNMPVLSVEAAEWYNRCICVDCGEQATHSMAGGLAGNACAARKSCDTNGTS